MAPEDIHYLIVKLKAEGFFEKEMTKALENEKRRKETKMNKTTLIDIKNLIHESKNIHGQTNSTNLIIESTNIKRALSNENYESHKPKSHTPHNPLTFFANTKEETLKPQESEIQNITIPQHSSSTNASLTFLLKN